MYAMLQYPPWVQHTKLHQAAVPRKGYLLYPANTIIQMNYRSLKLDAIVDTFAYLLTNKTLYYCWFNLQNNTADVLRENKCLLTVWPCISLPLCLPCQDCSWNWSIKVPDFKINDRILKYFQLSLCFVRDIKLILTTQIEKPFLRKCKYCSIRTIYVYINMFFDEWKPIKWLLYDQYKDLNCIDK